MRPEGFEPSTVGLEVRCARMSLVMTDNKRKNRFIEELDDDTPMEMSVMGDDGRFYNTIRELIEANERFAKLQFEKESKDKLD